MIQWVWVITNLRPFKWVDIQICLCKQVVQTTFFNTPSVYINKNSNILGPISSRSPMYKVGPTPQQNLISSVSTFVIIHETNNQEFILTSITIQCWKKKIRYVSKYRADLKLLKAVDLQSLILWIFIIGFSEASTKPFTDSKRIQSTV